jgi:hypothetical protein
MAEMVRRVELPMTVTAATAATAAAVPQAILKLHPEWVASNIWEFPRIHMSYTPQVSSLPMLPTLPSVLTGRV